MDERESWLYVNDFNFINYSDLTIQDDAATYIFSIYWTFTVMTTVGYGDYSGGTSREYLVSLLFEFTGFIFNAVLITTMSNVFASESSFDSLLTYRLD